jgi:hypothetical protein
MSVVFAFLGFAAVVRWLTHPSPGTGVLLLVFLVLYLIGWLLALRWVIVSSVELTADSLIVRSVLRRHVIPLRDIERCYRTISLFYSRTVAVEVRDGRQILCGGINMKARFSMRKSIEQAMAAIMAAAERDRAATLADDLISQADHGTATEEKPTA